VKIYHVSTFDQQGGAPRAAYNLSQALRQFGHDSRMFVSEGNPSDPNVKVHATRRDLRFRLVRYCRRMWIRIQSRKVVHVRNNGYDGFGSNYSQFGASPFAELFSADVINLHWISKFIDLPKFFSNVPMRLPVIWTLHDMFPFTGGCFYDAGCGKFRERCGACPILRSDVETDLSRDNWLQKKRALGNVSTERFAIVAPSHWMGKQARASGLMGNFNIEVIPNGVNSEEFAPRDQDFARSVLGLPQDSKVLLFLIGGSVARKGFGTVSELMQSMPHATNLHLLTVGAQVPCLGVSIPHMKLGYVANNRLLSLIYSAADVFIIPSTQDNLPNTVLEAMACGTPVVGFDCGGLPDMVSHGEDGFLVRSGDVGSLRSAVLNILADSDLRLAMSGRCRTKMLKQFSFELQARRYDKLYSRISLNHNAN
jgi:glycosyltransferase involved in cell wall biosynthesis